MQKRIYWNNICEIYFLTKHYLILSEEFSDDFDTFLRPIKEQRDAFDHIARVYGYSFLNEPIQNVELYQRENMKKALGHIYRAFFDTADWMTYICRRKIREMLNGHTKEEILAKYPQYEVVKQKLIDVPKAIAEIRQNKDINDDQGLIKEVSKYKVILDDLWEYYSQIARIFGV